MKKQISLSYLNDELAQVRTKKKEFLAQIEQIIPWGEWESIIQPYYYKGERGNKPYGLDLMLRLHILQNVYDLSDESTAAEVIDSRAFSDFCGIESSNQVPDGDTIGRFRNILVKNGLQEKLFAQVLVLLAERGLILKKEHCTSHTIREELLDQLIIDELQRTKRMYQQNWDGMQRLIDRWIPKQLSVETKKLYSQGQRTVVR